MTDPSASYHMYSYTIRILLDFFQLSSKREECEIKSTQSRNEYLLNMAAANAHQIRYFNIDLPELLQVM